MVQLPDKLKTLVNNRWLVFVASIMFWDWVFVWEFIPCDKEQDVVQTKTGGYVGVAKDLRDAIDLIAGSLCEVVPIWAVLFIGVVQNVVGYGLVWLTVTRVLPTFPLWLFSFSLNKCSFSDNNCVNEWCDCSN